MSSQEEFDFETDCSIGDLEYDSDMQITRLYVKVYQEKASLKELERLFNYYRNKVLEYLDLTSEMLKFLKQTYEDIIEYNLEDYINKGLDDFSRNIKDNKINIPSEVSRRVLNNFSIYFGLNRRIRAEYIVDKYPFRDLMEYQNKRSNVNITNIYLPGYTDNPLDISSHLNKSTYSLLVDFLIPYVYEYYNSDTFKKCSWYKFITGESVKRSKEYISYDLRKAHERGKLNNKKIEKIIGSEMYNKLKKDYDENNYSKELDYVYGITDCIEMLKNIAEWNCLKFKRFSLITWMIPAFYLPNNTGLFGLNTYLWSLYNDVKIIGVPSIFPQYDGIEGDCPGSFIEHDIDHTTDIYLHRAVVIANTKPIYYRLISDTELTLQQKKLMIMTIWVIIHENPRIDNKFTISTMLEEIGVPTIYAEFFHIFNSFRQLLLTPELFEDMRSFLRNSRSSSQSPDYNYITTKIDTYNDLRNIIDNNLIKIRLRGELYWKLCLYYTKAMIEKYYPDLVT